MSSRSSMGNRSPFSYFLRNLRKCRDFIAKSVHLCKKNGNNQNIGDVSYQEYHSSSLCLRTTIYLLNFLDNYGFFGQTTQITVLSYLCMLHLIYLISQECHPFRFKLLNPSISLKVLCHKLLLRHHVGPTSQDLLLDCKKFHMLGYLL